MPPIAVLLGERRPARRARPRSAPRARRPIRRRSRRDRSRTSSLTPRASRIRCRACLRRCSRRRADARRQHLLDPPVRVADQRPLGDADEQPVLDHARDRRSSAAASAARVADPPEMQIEDVSAPRRSVSGASPPSAAPPRARRRPSVAAASRSPPRDRPAEAHHLDRQRKRPELRHPLARVGDDHQPRAGRGDDLLRSSAAPPPLIMRQVRVELVGAVDGQVERAERLHRHERRADLRRQPLRRRSRSRRSAPSTRCATRSPSAARTRPRSIPSRARAACRPRRISSARAAAARLARSGGMSVIERGSGRRREGAGVIGAQCRATESRFGRRTRRERPRISARDRAARRRMMRRVPRRGPDVSQRLRHVQGRRRPVLVATRWARWSPPRASSTCCARRERIPGAGEAARSALAARQPRLHRQGPRHRPRHDPRPRGLHPRRLRRRPRRGRAGRDRARPARIDAARPAAARASTRDTDLGLRLRPRPARPRQRHGAARPGTRGQPASSRRPTIRSAAASSSPPRELDRGPPRRRPGPPVPYPFATADRDAARWRAPAASSIAAMKRANELARRDAADLDAGLARLWEVMSDCIDRGPRGDGHPARRPARCAAAPGASTRAAGRARPEPDRAAHHQRLDRRSTPSR